MLKAQVVVVSDHEPRMLLKPLGVAGHGSGMGATLGATRTNDLPLPRTTWTTGRTSPRSRTDLNGPDARTGIYGSEGRDLRQWHSA